MLTPAFRFLSLSAFSEALTTTSATSDDYLSGEFSSQRGLSFSSAPSLASPKAARRASQLRFRLVRIRNGNHVRAKTT